MKEAAISAAALTGLLAFAGIYNRHTSSRTRRDVTEELLSARPAIDEDEFADHTQEFMHDIANITEEDWYQMQVGLGMPEDEILPFEMNEEDVEAKARRRKKGKNKEKAATMAAFKLKDVPALHIKMQQTHDFRVRSLLGNFVADAGIGMAINTPVELLDDTGRKNSHIVNNEYPDYSGADKTAPSIQKFLDEFEYDDKGRHLFGSGQNQMWFLIPAAVPLFGDAEGHLSEYPEYWAHVNNWRAAFDQSERNLKVSIGLYHKGAVYSPKGTNYRRGKFPWGRISGYYMRPRTTTSMPYIIPTADSLISWIPRYGSSSAAAGQDCFLIWFHQDFAADANQLLVPEQFAKVDQLYQMCNVAHVFVGFKQSEETKAYASAIVPGLQSRVSKDPDFASVFFAENLKEISSGPFMQNMFRFATVIKNRAGCRTNDAGYVPPASVGPGLTAMPPAEGITFPPGTAGPGATGAAGTVAALLEATGLAPTGGADLAAITGAPGTAAPDSDYGLDGTVAPTDRGLMEGVTKIPEVDSCCGHDLFGGVPYDSELRTCCEDGQPQAFTEDGTDPCLGGAGDLGFSFKK